MAVVNSFRDIHDLFAPYRDQKAWLFRGQAHSVWNLLPKCGRKAYCWVDGWQVFNAWKRRAIQFINISPTSDWEWLAVGQHHGLATRLLDWTTNPLYAAYFAARELPDQDGAILAARISNEIDISSSAPQECQLNMSLIRQSSTCL